VSSTISIQRLPVLHSQISVERREHLALMILFHVSSIVDSHLGLSISTPKPWRAISFGTLNSPITVPLAPAYTTPHASHSQSIRAPQGSPLIPIALCFLPLWRACGSRQSGPRSCRVAMELTFRAPHQTQPRSLRTRCLPTGDPRHNLSPQTRE
jgi:hypothetical protein